MRQRGEKREREAVVVACSALTIQYRNLLRGEEARFVLPSGKEVTAEKHLDPHIETYFVYRAFEAFACSAPPVVCSQLTRLPRSQCKAPALCSSTGWSTARATL
jgi:hypothetical protein